jgi:hypothetical protein
VTAGALARALLTSQISPKMTRFLWRQKLLLTFEPSVLSIPSILGTDFDLDIVNRAKLD